MNKNFSYEDEELQILGLPESNAISIYVFDSDDDEAQIDIPVSDGPAMMQAIAECLPPIPDIVRDGSYEAYMAVVMEYLDKAVRALEIETFKAEERAELEAEAVKLANAGREASVVFEREPVLNFHELDTEFWIAVARKSRELRAGK